jgi:hypothetical protein
MHRSTWGIGGHSSIEITLIYRAGLAVIWQDRWYNRIDAICCT